jgi:putative NADH-flavin reductase
MKIAMFGVTGTVGSVLLRRALADGHEVHALVRAPDKLGATGERFLVTKGDACDDDDVDAVVSGAGAVLSALGGVRGPESLSRGTEAIIRAMTTHRVRRLIVAQGFHLTFAGDAENPGKRAMRQVVKYAISRGIAEHSVALPRLVEASGLDWTVVRFPRVVTGRGSSAYRTGPLRLAPWSTVRDVDVADFMLQCLDHATAVRQAPMIASRN